MVDIRSILLRQQETVKQVIDFFLAEAINPKAFLDIKRICSVKRTVKQQHAIQEINEGYLSAADFIVYQHAQNLGEDNTRIKVIDFTLQLLAEKMLVNERDSVFRHGSEPRFKASVEYARYAYENDLILNLIFGFSYIIQKYQHSVFKIEHVHKDGTHSIGTGFLMGDDSQSIIVTNRHVLEDFKTIVVRDKDDAAISYNHLVLDAHADLGLIFIEHLNRPGFMLNETIEVMSEVITIGYPSIPMAKFAYQVYHKGEVNSFIEDYQSNKLFLFSAKTSSGNSGSPVIDKNGMVIGIVTEELFEKDQFYEKGKPPYYAAIPSTEIDRFINAN
ncbi:MAG: serine protease [Cyclobacteriaceae bacterium]